MIYVFLACALLCATTLVLKMSWSDSSNFVTRRGTEFYLNDKPFRFISANAAVIYGETERESLPTVFDSLNQTGVRVVRVWAHGEWDGQDKTGRAPNDWLLEHPFRRGADEWNEEAFRHLDYVLAEARKRDLRVQLCLSNWWRDTGGVVQYLAWAGIDAADSSQPFGINTTRAMEFYTNERARLLYKQHVEKIVARRNSISGELYKNDSTIFAYELMNEAQSETGRESERRAWTKEMARFIKSIDANHLVTSGVWSYRTARERREWLRDYELPEIDFCDVHLYPQDDEDSFVTSLDAQREFVENRAAAAREIGKPLVFGEYNIKTNEFAGKTKHEWFENFFSSCVRYGVSGAGVWIWTTDLAREYGITPHVERDEIIRNTIASGAREIEAAHASNRQTSFDANLFRVPYQRELVQGENREIESYVWRNGARQASALNDYAGVSIDKAWLKNNVTSSLELKNSETSRVPLVDDAEQTISWQPAMWRRVRFERVGVGENYVWGAGVGFIEYEANLPVLSKQVRQPRVVIVRAWLQPVIPHYASGRIRHTSVTLFVDDANCGTREVGEITAPFEGKEIMHEWQIAARRVYENGGKLILRFAVEPDARAPFGINISNFPARYEATARAPVEVSVR